MTFVICQLHLINTIKIMTETVHLNEGANSSAANSVGLDLAAVLASRLREQVERLTVLLLWPFTLSITKSSSHRLASFHLLTPTQMPRLVLISEAHVCVCAHTCLCACKLRREKI